MRIAIARRPFSDGMEITAVRPIVDITLKDYAKADLITKRITSEKRGMIVVGSPGSGKTTLAQSIATYLSDSGYVVKTMEAPRELQVPDQITQYTMLDGSMANTADVLLLVRPDFVIFDELRKNEDFNVFADMRLAGLGMVGVIHANGVQDAIQRFSDRVDFSVISQIVNTIIFVRQGVITKIYDVGFTIKVPEGMAAEMHLRPVTIITDHETGELVIDVFRYDGETIVMPMTAVTGSSKISPSGSISPGTSGPECRGLGCLIWQRPCSGCLAGRRTKERNRRTSRLETHGKRDPARDRTLYGRLCQRPDDQRYKSYCLYR